VPHMPNNMRCTFVPLPTSRTVASKSEKFTVLRMFKQVTRFSQSAVDAVVVLACWWLAFWLRFNLDIPDEFGALLRQSTPMMLMGYALAWFALRLQRQVWRYTGLPELRQLALAVCLGAALAGAAILMHRYPNFPRSVLLIHPLIVLLSVAAFRAAWRSLTERQSGLGSPLLIVGNLADASDALRALKGSQQWIPVGIVSPAASDAGRSLLGIPVLGGPDKLIQVAQATASRTVLVASAPGSADRRSILLNSAEAGLTLLTMPRPDEWLRAESAGPRRIELEDLLGRDPVRLDIKGLSELFAGRTVLVTGAGGSIGSELCRQIARFGVARMVCVDVSEVSVYRLEQDLRQAHPQMAALYYTANVREADRLEAIFEQHRPAVVFHAAAYKHVPLMEEHNEIEALRTNVLGTVNAARAAGRWGAKRFVMISTDKAVNPTNVMGASKRVAELAVQAVAGEFAATQFVSVRFGNVLGSSGSVVPLFTEQIARGGPVTVTHPEIVRYFMTIPEAAQLLLQAGLMGQSGQIYVLDMGEPVKIVELARIMIRLSGKSEQDIPIAFTGLRPGEKLYEELLADDETTVPTPHPKLRAAKASGVAAGSLAGVCEWIAAAGAAPDAAALRRWLKSQVPEYLGIP